MLTLITVLSYPLFTIHSQVSSEMNVFTMVFGDLETHIVSVERIREYSVVQSEVGIKHMCIALKFWKHNN